MAQTPTDCDCGFIDTKDPTNSIWNSLLVIDFTKVTIAQLKDIFILASYNVTKSTGSYVRSYNTENVQLNQNGLQLTCSTSTDGKTVPSAGLFTRARTFYYGSYSAKYLVDTVPGTIAGFFHYKNDTSEIDIEYLSSNSSLQNSVKPQQYLSNGAASNTTYHKGWINDISNSSDWSFTWKPDEVYYGIDGNYTKSITTNVPHAPGRIFMNHWSDGDPKFSRGPPERDSTVTVSFLQAVYNDTDAGPLACVKMKAACLVTDGVVKGRFASPDASGQLGLLAVAYWFFWSRAV